MKFNEFESQDSNNQGGRVKRSIIIASLVLALSGSAIAEEKSTLDTIKANVNINEPNNKVTVWIKNEWEDIKAYQRQGWADGKAQLAKLPDELKAVPSNIANGVKQIGNDLNSLVQKVAGTGNKDVGTDKN